MKWGWLWRVRAAVLPALTTADISTKFIRFRSPGLGELLLRELMEGQEVFVSTNGVRAWILPDMELKSFGTRLERDSDSDLHAANMTTGPGVLANMSMTMMVPVEGVPVPVGDSLTYAVRKHTECIELSGAFTSSDAVTNGVTQSAVPKETISLHTNLTLAAQMIIPKGRGVFLYDTNRADARSAGVGLLIRVKVK